MLVITPYYLFVQGKMTHEAASMAKAWTTLRGREVVALGRELLGGNGIVADFLVAKAFCDMEAYYTYEGACIKQCCAAFVSAHACTLCCQPHLALCFKRQTGVLRLFACS